MALTVSDITWASLSETRNNRDIIAVSVSERLCFFFGIRGRVALRLAIIA